jgi:pimeloyl-ACP methyl ester carboxylesterase
MQNIYCISGLGADEKVFSNLQLPGYNIVFLPWLIPTLNESIEGYAKKMLASIHEPNPILMGLSFGGMMCVEIAKLMPVKHIVIISSIKTNIELPLWMKVCGKLRLNKIIPIKQYKLLQPVQNKRLGVTTSQEKNLANYYRSNINQQYLKWAVQQILNWQNKIIPTYITHIHGDKDKMFGIKNIQASMVIKNGGHFMIMNKANEISKAIVNALNK